MQVTSNSLSYSAWNHFVFISFTIFCIFTPKSVFSFHCVYYLLYHLVLLPIILFFIYIASLLSFKYFQLLLKILVASLAINFFLTPLN